MACVLNATHSRGLKIDRRSAGTGQCRQFAGVDDAVAVEVAPDFQLREIRISGGDFAVEIGIERGERHEPVLRRIAEQGNTGRALVANQEPSLRPDPARLRRAKPLPVKS